MKTPTLPFESEARDLIREMNDIMRTCTDPEGVPWEEYMEPIIRRALLSAFARGSAEAAEIVDRSLDDLLKRLPE